MGILKGRQVVVAVKDKELLLGRPQPQSSSELTTGQLPRARHGDGPELLPPRSPAGARLSGPGSRRSGPNSGQVQLPTHQGLHSEEWPSAANVWRYFPLGELEERGEPGRQLAGPGKLRTTFKAQDAPWQGRTQGLE